MALALLRSPDRLAARAALVEEIPQERTLRPYQRSLVDEVYRHVKANTKKILIIAGGGLGKAQPLTAKILTPGGFKLMGELKVGDLVIGGDGQHCRIRGVYPQGVKPVYRVTFSDGSSTLCCEDHLWNVQSHKMASRKGVHTWKTESLKEIQKTYIRHREKSDRVPSGEEKIYKIPMVGAVDFFPVKDPLPFSPYALGLLLGDGCFADEHTIGFSCPDVELQDSLASALLKPCKMRLASGMEYDFRIVGDGCKQGNQMLELLRSLGLSGHKSESKFIPDVYLWASPEDRLSILQGLFDTDGYAAGSGCVEYSTASKVMSEQVTFLVRSLGGTATFTIKRPKFTHKGESRIGQDSYRMVVKLPKRVDPFRLTRKLEKYNNTYQDRYKARRMIVDIQPEGETECQCISVDSPSGLYVTDDFIVTHNTTCAAWIMRDCSVRAKRTALRSVFLVERNCLLEQAANTLKSLGVGCSIIQGNRKVKWSEPTMVASLQTLSSWEKSGKDPKKLLGKVGLFVLDEAHDGVGQSAYQHLQEVYGPTGTIFLGLTASPWRMSKEEFLGRWFDATVMTLQPPEAVKEGWLAASRNYSQSGVFDLSQVNVGDNGDYDDGGMARQAMRPEALQLVVDDWKRLGEGQPTIVFCSTVAQAKAQCDKFNENAIAADWQSGSVSRTKRETQDAALNDGALKVICSVGTQTKGYDNPCIGCVIFVRATKSKSLFFQAAWRGCRPFAGNSHLPPKQYFTILDFGGNLDRHGNPMGYQDYDISDQRSPHHKKTEAPTKDCPKCSEKNLLTFLKVCPNCGHEFGNKDRQETLFDPALYQLKEWFDPIGCEQLQFLRSRKSQLFREKQSPQLAADEFFQKFGYQPPDDWHRWAVFGKRSGKEQRAKYFEYLKQHGPHDYWIQRHMALEFGDSKSAPPKFLATWKEQWWEVLGVARTAAPSEVKTAYLALAKQWHPDTAKDKKNAETQMKIVNVAWEKYQDARFQL